MNSDARVGAFTRAEPGPCLAGQARDGNPGGNDKLAFGLIAVDWWVKGLLFWRPVLQVFIQPGVQPGDLALQLLELALQPLDVSFVRLRQILCAW